jgi:hypothetical protein
VLDIERDATEADIKKAFNRLAKAQHPDRTGGASHESFVKVYTCITDIRYIEQKLTSPRVELPMRCWLTPLVEAPTISNMMNVATRRKAGKPEEMKRTPIHRYQYKRREEEMTDRGKKGTDKKKLQRNKKTPPDERLKWSG